MKNIKIVPLYFLLFFVSFYNLASTFEEQLSNTEKNIQRVEAEIEKEIDKARDGLIKRRITERRKALIEYAKYLRKYRDTLIKRINDNSLEELPSCDSFDDQYLYRQYDKYRSSTDRYWIRKYTYKFPKTDEILDNEELEKFVSNLDEEISKEEQEIITAYDKFKNCIKGSKTADSSDDGAYEYNHECNRCVKFLVGLKFSDGNKEGEGLSEEELRHLHTILMAHESPLPHGLVCCDGLATNGLATRGWQHELTKAVRRKVAGLVATEHFKYLIRKKRSLLEMLDSQKKVLERKKHLRTQIN